MSCHDGTRQPEDGGTELVLHEAGHTLDAPMEQCEYCGAPLVPAFYFCCACAAPYKSIDAVLSPVTPAPLSEGELIQRKAPYVATLFWSYLGTALLGAVLAELLFNEDRPDLRLMLQLGALLITTCIFSVIFWTSLKMQFRQPGFLHPAAYIGLAILVPTLAVNFVYCRFITRVFSIENPLPFTALRDAGMSEAALVLIFCLYPAVSEEIGFRGLLQHWLQVAIRPERAILLAAFLFAVLHFSLLSLPYLFGIGVLLGWTKWKTGSLYPSMLIHFLHNFFVIEFM